MRLDVLAVLIGTMAAAGGVWFLRHDTKVIQAERARVEEKGKKTDAKAQLAKRRAVTDADRMLERYYRDR